MLISSGSAHHTSAGFKIRFNYLIELGNTTSDWTTGDDVHTRAKGGGVM